MKKALQNQIMLITYPDSLGHNLKDLDEILANYFAGAIGGLHILPFFPSSGDRGFAPLEYEHVDPAFGDWRDIERLSEKYYLMCDFMINHISAHSKYYLDFLQKKEASPWKDLFIRYRDFWQDGEPTAEQVDAIYKRKPRAPYTISHFADGSQEKVWCTFGEEQIDLNLQSKTGQKFVDDTLKMLCKHGISLLRLDAVGYVTKKAGTSCFFVEPEIWDVLAKVNHVAESFGSMVLPEVHEHYSMPLKIAQHGYYVYDFALPMLLLNAIYYGQSQYLKHWFSICPRRQFTTLDTHDGIGVVDVKDLLPDAEIEKTKNDIFNYGANVKKVYNTAAYHNLDIYQVNCTYYSALGDDDSAYLLARAVQFFAPGIPQVYYVGMLAGKNDLKLLEETKEGRNINRHYYTKKEVQQETLRPVVSKLLEMMRFRNRVSAFDGSFEMLPCSDRELRIRRANGSDVAILEANLQERTFLITHNGNIIMRV